MSADTDSERSRRLLFAAELADGTISARDLARAPVREATRSRRVPSRLSRAYQRRLMRRGALAYEDETVARAMAARAAVLGAEGATGPPRLLVRVSGRHGPAAPALRRAHELLAGAGVPHLVSVRPAPLERAERAALDDLRRAGVAFGMHGVGGDGGPLRRLKPDGVAARVDAAEARLAEHAVAPDVLVADEPLPLLGWEPVAERFAVVVAGEEAIGWMGYHDTPLWRGEAVWMPSYAPFDGPAADAAEGVRSLVARGAALWVPVAIDPAAEEADGFAGLRRFAEAAAGHAVPWPDFLDTVRASR